MRNPEAALHALELRGRRIAQSVLVFSATGEGVEGLVRMGAKAVPLEHAAEAVMQTLSQEPPLPVPGTER
jgi:hypothetical protein